MEYYLLTEIQRLLKLSNHGNPHLVLRFVRILCECSAPIRTKIPQVNDSFSRGCLSDSVINNSVDVGFYRLLLNGAKLEYIWNY